MNRKEVDDIVEHYHAKAMERSRYWRNEYLEQQKYGVTHVPIDEVLLTLKLIETHEYLLHYNRRKQFHEDSEEHRSPDQQLPKGRG